MHSAMIRGIFFSEFDNTLGPRIVYQHPDALLSAEEFDSVSEYVICKPQLCSNVIAVSAGEWIVMGCPVLIEHAKYHRNALLFNLGFVFSSAEPLASTIPFRPVVSKLAGILQTMETEAEFLYNVSDRDRLFACIPHIMHDLNESGECALSIEGYIGFPIYLQVDRHEDLMSRILAGDQNLLLSSETIEHQIPMIVEDTELVRLVTDEWDLSLRYIIPLIDGQRAVSAIAAHGDVEISIVVAAIQHLVYYDFVRLVDPVDFACVYVSTVDIGYLYRDPALQKQCLEFVQSREEGAPVASFSDVFRRYCDLRPGLPFSSFLAQRDFRSAGIDERRFLQYGLFNRFIQRAQQYNT